MMFPRITREGYFKFVIIMLLMLLLLFDTEMAMIYILILLGDFLWFKFDNKITFQIESRTDNRFSSLLQVAIASVAFFLISKFALQSFFGDPGTMQSVLSLFATTTPILAGNQFLKIIVWAGLIPFIESIFFFGNLLEGFATYGASRLGTKIDITKISIQSIIVVLFVSALFALFHLTSKQLSSPALMLTFIFAIISCLLVIYNRELKQAIEFHVVINLLAVLSSLNLI